MDYDLESVPEITSTAPAKVTETLTETVVPEKTPKGETKAPSFKNYLAATKEKPQFSENVDPILKETISQSNIVAQKFQTLKDLTPENRAARGAKLGGAIGLSVSGPAGALVGANLGAIVSRAVGAQQSGEQDQFLRRNKVIDYFKTTGLANEENKIDFEDGGSFPLVNTSQDKLPNVSGIVTGKQDRTHYEVDSSNPLTKRSLSMAKPIADYLTYGVMGLSDRKDAKNSRTYNDTLGFLVNSMQSGSTGIGTSVNRARQITDKLGISKQQLNDYFYTIRNTMSKQDADELKKGIDAIYG